jgi:peptidoglycan-associated lipoprotein
MQSLNVNLKQLRTLGIFLTCGALAIGCAGNSVKPLTQESEPVTTTPVATNSDTSSNTPVQAEKQNEVATPPVSESSATTPESASVVAENTPNSESHSAIQQPAQLTFYFGLNKTVLDEKDKEILKEHARFLKANPTLVLEINGHTDSKGPHHYNEFLSKLRAESVATVLIAEGITRSQLVINALADDKPVADANDPGKNRRVELQYDEMNVVSNK